MQANLNSLTAVSSHVMSVSNSIVDLGAAITNAIVGLTNLQAVWDLINEYIIAAKDSLMQVDGTTKLFRFENFVLTARNSWAEVPSLALGMLDIFNEAYKEADKNKK
jgi:hypothetical protein